MADDITLPDVTVTAQPIVPSSPPISNPPSYAARSITLTFLLSSQSKQIQYTGLRIKADVSDAHIPHGGYALLRINGITLSDMNELTVAGLQYYARAAGRGQAGANFVSISAGTSGNEASIFTGVITDAYPDGRQPDMGFIVKATPSVGFTMPPATPTAFTGSTPISQVFQQLASKAGLSLQNNGVMGTLANPYYSGSIYDQIKDALQATNCYGAIDSVNKRLIVTPKVGSQGAAGTIFSPANAMINYPQFESQNIVVRTLFDPSLVLVGGSPFTVQGSQFTAANGRWWCSKVDYDLSSQMPGGPWEMVVRGYPQTGAPTG